MYKYNFLSAKWHMLFNKKIRSAFPTVLLMLAAENLFKLDWTL